ncbi:MAG: ABC transporter ATP-binding protein [Phycisphaerales bacterium]|nr:ABC transporter ATP-binding protein [Phycisphaerales bacterium]
MPELPTIAARAARTTPAGARGAARADLVVNVQHLSKVFRDFWLRQRVKAVDDVSFEVRRGEIFGLLGPNGSGKSTTIKILLGLLHKTGGLVTVLDRLPSDVAVKAKVGYLPEESYLYQFLNARETLDYYAKLFGLDSSVRERRIDELLDMVGLTAVQFRPVREYSKGMQRRIGIAQALINDPELLILDEPTTGLDPLGTRQVKDLILELGRRGKTIILSSHLLSDVEDCVDRMVILYGGKIQAEGTCDSLLESQDKTTIESDALDDATIAEIDRLIRSRSNGAQAITRVARPRQRLEDLFVDIVERARAAKIATAGAQHGGQTAAFLKGEAEGENLISALTAKDDAPIARAVEAAPARRGPDEGVIGDLLGKTKEPEPQAPSARPTAPGQPATPARPAPADVDQSVIGSLLGKDPNTDGHGKGQA